MKAILEFNLPEDKLEHQRAVKSTDAFLALWDIAQDVFRPARKHGYQWSDELNKLNEKEEVAAAISLLEQRFYEIVNDRGVNPSDNLE